MLAYQMHGAIPATCVNVLWEVNLCRQMTDLAVWIWVWDQTCRPVHAGVWFNSTQPIIRSCCALGMWACFVVLMAQCSCSFVGGLLPLRVQMAHV